MAGATIKKEHTSLLHETCSDPREHQSSGATIVIDSDSTMTDEGYVTNHQAKRPSMNRGVSVDTRNGSAGQGHDSDSSLQVLGRGVKKLVQVVQELRHLGVEDLNLPLPKIVVVGNQSTGKSSLIEGISEIKVPRSAGTCTRCPMELNISESSAPWSCQVTLHKKFIYTTAKSAGATKTRPLGPWMLQEAEDYPFATVTNKKDVADMIYLAQMATLNPRNAPEKYLPGMPKSNDQHQVKFSPNVVRLDISGPNLPNLSFYDLPGVINVSELAEEAYLVDLIKNLVKEYIKADDCINLLAVSMTDDPANSSASKLIHEVKAGARTLGCLTKPDRMQEAEGSAWEQWIQVLSGERFRLGFGYHVVMNNPDVSVSHAVARREEETFFSEQEPWATSLNEHTDRFGTSRLQTVLAQRLTAQIRKSLPRISEQIERKAEEIEVMLSQLPEPLDRNLAVGVMSELMRFERQLKENIDGSQKANPFQKEWNAMAKKFRQDLADSRPVLVFSSTRSLQQDQSMCGTPSPITPTAKSTVPITIVSDDSDDGSLRIRPNTTQIGQKRSPNSTYTTPKKLKRSMSDSPTSKRNEVSSKRFSLAEVQSHLQDAYNGLSNLIHPRAVEKMIILSMEHWEGPLHRFLASTRELCEGMVFEQVQMVYGKYLETEYFETIRKICEGFFEKAFAEHREILQRLLRWEQARPKTCNDEAIDLAQAKALSLLQSRRRDIRAARFLDELEARTGKISNGQARVEKLARITDDQLGPDPYKKEIEAMTTVKAYYECAYFRFVDVVCSSIYCELFAKCRDDIVKEMKDVFRLTESNVEQRLAILLAANPAQEQRRAQLKKEMDTIAQARERLAGLTDDD